MSLVYQWKNMHNQNEINKHKSNNYNNFASLLGSVVIPTPLPQFTG